VQLATMLGRVSAPSHANARTQLMARNHSTYFGVDEGEFVHVETKCRAERGDRPEIDDTAHRSEPPAS
jgi:hypothetical protein